MRDGWRETTLREVATRTIGRTPPRNDPSMWATSTERPFVTIADLGLNRTVTAREGVSELAEASGHAKRFPAGSLLLSFKLSIGRVGVADRDVFTNEAIARLAPVDGVLRDFLAIALENVNWEDLGGRAVKGKTMNKSSLDAVPITLPPLDEQRRIVDLIAAVDDALEAAEEEVDDSQRAWAIVCDSIAVAPDAVERKVSQLVATAKSGGTPSRANPAYYGGAIPWLKSGEVRGRTIATTSESITDEALAGSSAWIAPADSVLVAMYGGGTVGQVGQLAAPMATNQAVLALVADPAVIASRMLYHLLSSDSDRLAAKAVGAAQANISKKVVLDHVVHVLPPERQSEVVGALDAFLDAADAARATAESLRTLRSNLLTVLLSGEHEIPSSYDALLEEVA